LEIFTSVSGKVFVGLGDDVRVVLVRDGDVVAVHGEEQAGRAVGAFQLQHFVERVADGFRVPGLVRVEQPEVAGGAGTAVGDAEGLLG
jgi:hypothetical protein